VGAYFNGHPTIQSAVVQREFAAHPSTFTLPEEWPRTDEWYNFRDDPTPEITVLLTVDEGSYNGGTMGEFHPLAWFHEYDNGQAWYTAMGHTSQSYAEPDFQAHVLGGIQWAAGMDLSADYVPVLIKD
jgi:type 1 glutamine amidotransferase